MTPEQVVPAMQEGALHPSFLTIPEQRNNESETAEIRARVLSLVTGYMGKISLEVVAEPISNIEETHETEAFIDLDEAVQAADSIRQYLR